MKVVFVSNYFNHHQKSLSDALFAHLNTEYSFIATSHMSKERSDLGYKELDAPYVSKYFIAEKQCQQNIDNADVVIFGSAPPQCIRKRLWQGKLTIGYSERLFKNDKSYINTVLRAIKWNAIWFKRKKTYLLCSSAYTSKDYYRIGLFHGRTFRWGYFPETKKYDIDSLISKKKPHSILWVARFLVLKHPEVPIEIAKRLKRDGFNFELNMIGTGELVDSIQRMIQSESLQDKVHMLGSMPPEDVRKHMEESEIFLFTSDRNEGWGAVLNESMNSGCAVVASHAIGSVPFLIENEKNGCIYPNGNIEVLYMYVKRLLNENEYRESIQRNAYDTIANQWSAEEAARRFLELATNLLNGNEASPFSIGPCSKAELLSDDWMK